MKHRNWTGFVLAFALVFPGIGALGYFVLAQDQWLKVVYSLSKLIQFSLPAVWIFLVLKEPFSLTKFNFSNAVSGLKTGLVLFALALVAFFLFEQNGWLAGSGEAILSKINSFGVATPLKYAVMAFYIAILHSFMEEYYWRWFVFRKLREYANFPIALLISSFGFTLHHIVVISFYAPKTHSILLTLLASLSVFFAGCVWAYQYEKGKSLWTVWISHLLADLAVMLIGYLLVF